MSSLVAWKQTNLIHLDAFEKAWEFQHLEIKGAYKNQYEQLKGDQ